MEIYQSCYTDSRPYDPPASAFTGFLRFLTLLSVHDWQTEPLLVDLQESRAPSDQTNLTTKFRWLRKTEPKLSPMFVAVPQDRPHWRPIWGTASPSRLIVRRVVQFATVSLQVLQQSFAPTSAGFVLVM